MEQLFAPGRSIWEDIGFDSSLWKTKSPKDMLFLHGGGRARLGIASFLLVLLTAISSPCRGAGAVPFEKLYDHYFPKHGESLNSGNRRYFDDTLFGVPPSREYRPRSRQLYHAFRGDSSAFHAFVQNPDRDAGGEFGGSWVSECVVLLLRLGDERFAGLLAGEDRKTREKVGMAIDPQIEWDKHQFSKTRALYSYRWVPLSQSEILKRQQGPALTALVVVTPNEAIRLRAALAMDSRFNDVQVHATGRKGKLPALIVAPRTLSKNDMADLGRIIQVSLHSNKPIVFK